MDDRFCFGKGHPPPEVMEEGLSLSERKLLLSQLESCPEYMDAYLETLTEDVLLSPPEGMEARILDAIHLETLRQRRDRSLAMQIVRLAVAVCLTMVLSVGGVFQALGEAPVLFLEKQQENALEERILFEKRLSEQKHSQPSRLEPVQQEDPRQDPSRPSQWEQAPGQNVLGVFFDGMNASLIDFAKTVNRLGRGQADSVRLPD